MDSAKQNNAQTHRIKDWCESLDTKKPERPACVRLTSRISQGSVAEAGLNVQWNHNVHSFFSLFGSRTAHMAEIFECHPSDQNYAESRQSAKRPVPHTILNGATPCFDKVQPRQFRTIMLPRSLLQKKNQIFALHTTSAVARLGSLVDFAAICFVGAKSSDIYSEIRAAKR